MLLLSMKASKFGFLLLAVIAIPCIFEMRTILSLWLKQVPEYTVLFCTLILIGIMVNQLTIGVQSAIQATGRIHLYQLVVGSFLLLNLPTAYLLLRNGASAYSVFISYIFVEIIACVLRLLFLKKIAGLSIKEYGKNVFAKIIIPALVLIGLCLAITHIVGASYRIFITLSIPVVAFVASVYFWGLDSEERSYIKKTIISVYNKVYFKN